MPVGVYSEAQWLALENRVAALEDQARRALSMAGAAGRAAAGAVNTSAKRYRIGIFTTALVSIGGTVSGNVKWSTPITDAAGNEVDVYNVDAACSAMPNTRWAFTTSNMSKDGVSISFTAPVLLSLGSIVVVLAVAPAV